MPSDSDYVISKPVSRPPIKLSQDEMSVWNEDYHGRRDHVKPPPTDIKEAEEDLKRAMDENQNEKFEMAESLNSAPFEKEIDLT